MIEQNDEATWLRSQKLVVHELERLNEGQKEMMKAITALEVGQGRLDIKSGVWGLVGGMLAVLIGILVAILTKSLR